MEALNDFWQRKPVAPAAGYISNNAFILNKTRQNIWPLIKYIIYFSYLSHSGELIRFNYRS